MRSSSLLWKLFHRCVTASIKFPAHRALRSFEAFSWLIQAFQPFVARLGSLIFQPELCEHWQLPVESDYSWWVPLLLSRVTTFLNFRFKLIVQLRTLHLMGFLTFYFYFHGTRWVHALSSAWSPTFLAAKAKEAILVNHPECDTSFPFSWP